MYREGRKYLRTDGRKESHGQKERNIRTDAGRTGGRGTMKMK